MSAGIVDAIYVCAATGMAPKRAPQGDDRGRAARQRYAGRRESLRARSMASWRRQA